MPVRSRADRRGDQSLRSFFIGCGAADAPPEPARAGDLSARVLRSRADRRGDQSLRSFFIGCGAADAPPEPARAGDLSPRVLEPGSGVVAVAEALAAWWRDRRRRCQGR